MGANFKRELILGMVSIALFTILILVHVIQYQNRKISSNIPVVPVNSTNLTAITQSPTTSTSTPSTAPTQAKQQLTSNVIAQHNNANDCWIIVQGKVYAVSNYLSQHPGGAEAITPYCGQDATQAFVTMGGRGGHSQRAYNDLTSLYIGDLNGTITQQQTSGSTTTAQSTSTNVGGIGRSNDDD